MGLNPTDLDNYIGQEQIKKNLRIIFRAKQSQFLHDVPMDHTLLSGPPGTGKTALAEIISKELERPLVKLMGPHVKDPEDFSFLKKTKSWTFLFIDEIHSIPSKVEEALYELMDDFKFKGESINSFTLIGATTKEGSLSKPLLSRFTIIERLSPYEVGELSKIVLRSAIILKLSIEPKAAEEIAKRSKGTPRIANQLLKRVSYYSSDITLDNAQNALDNLRICSKGLDPLDRTILRTMMQTFNCGPVGLQSLANVVGEDITTIDVKESYLVTVGLIKRTGRGRVLTAEGIKYLGDLREIP